MSERRLRLLFEIEQAEHEVRNEALDQDLIKIGKLPSSHVWIDDASVSRMHAVIERGADGGFSVLDLGSASGTFVNGERITKAAVQDGDELQFGDVIVRVRFDFGIHPGADSSQIIGADDVTAEVDLPMLENGLKQAPAAPSVSSPREVGSGDVSTPEVSPVLDEASVPASVDVAPAASEQASIQLDDGTVVQPYTVVGYYDDYGNYIPGYYDEHGQFYYGYGYYDEAGQWIVAHGYYDPDGQWIETANTDDATPQGGAATPGQSLVRRSDKDVYTASFFADQGGDMLEVAFLFNDHVLGIKTFSDVEKVTIGPDKNNDFIVDHDAVSDEKYPFIIKRDGHFYLTVTRSMEGIIRNADQQYFLQDVLEQSVATPSPDVAGAYSIPIGARTSARVEFGSTTLLVRFTETPALVGGGLRFDSAPYPYLVVSAIAHILFLLLAMNTPDEARRLELDGLNPNNRFVELLVKAEQVEETPKADWLGSEDEAAAHRGDEGSAGLADSQQKNKEMTIQGEVDPKDVELRRAQDTEVAKTAGALEVLLTSEWGSSERTIGSDALTELGNLSGDGPGHAQGAGGLGISGAGRGGGSVSESGIGMASVGTAGRGGGGSGGAGYGREAADMGKHNTGVPQMVPGRPVVTGALDREIIQRVVRQHRNEIRHCYEQELQRNRSLTGRVQVRFTISPTGSVVSVVVSETTLGNVTVERCIASRIQRWVFPEPKGGGIVTVTYPFNFSPG